MSSISIELFDALKPQKSLALLENVSPDTSIRALKKIIAENKHLLPADRQSLRLDAKGKALRDEQTVGMLNLPSKGAQLFIKDLGPQVGWTTVFLAEYGGPLLIYPIFFMRPSVIYGDVSSSVDIAVALGLLCWTFHYLKRILETIFVHRFSNATMPRFNLFKNCTYYWGFTAFISYFINHPLYTPPAFGAKQVFGALAAFIFCEMGNLSIHLLLRNLRPPGTKIRKVPIPNKNPLTKLFLLVSCPNYTYEVGSWIAFSIMTQSLPALIFTICGFMQMAIWAQAKHRAYLRDFPSYPKSRKAIVPFLL
ncbi:hypothetical protein AB6A40_000212 [Gnathostoma spinigerum]|uniref:very-long-chain enoyl-CoA reductase n=1 Tax=Gnathostoma spinigerum TaxID=75299 RepID=A0ABD6E1R1_9BILA